jgi:hypothetical protein
MTLILHSSTGRILPLQIEFNLYLGASDAIIARFISGLIYRELRTSKSVWKIGNHGCLGFWSRKFGTLGCIGMSMWCLSAITKIDGALLLTAWSIWKDWWRFQRIRRLWIQKWGWIEVRWYWENTSQADLFFLSNHPPTLSFSKRAVPSRWFTFFLAFLCQSLSHAPRACIGSLYFHCKRTSRLLSNSPELTSTPHANIELIANQTLKPPCQPSPYRQTATIRRITQATIHRRSCQVSNRESKSIRQASLGSVSSEENLPRLFPVCLDGSTVKSCCAGWPRFLHNPAIWVL